MKNLLFIPLFVFLSCEEEPVTPPTTTPPPTSTTPTLIGDWGWQKTVYVTYDETGNQAGTNEIPYNPATNKHNFSADGNVYAGATIAGTHNGSSQVTFTLGTPVTFTVTNLTTTSFILKQFPTGCMNCTDEWRYYVK